MIRLLSDVKGTLIRATDGDIGGCESEVVSRN